MFDSDLQHKKLIDTTSKAFNLVENVLEYAKHGMN
jgi:hypothetical protein